MMEFAKIYVRSITMIVSTTIGICYMAAAAPELLDPTTIGGWLAGCVAVAVFDKPVE